MKMIAKTLMGLEEVLARELRELGMKGVSVGGRMVEAEPRVRENPQNTA